MMLLAGDLLPSDVGCTVALTSNDSIRGRLDAIETRLGGYLMDLTVDGKPFAVLSDLLIHVDRQTPTPRDALLRANAAVTHELLMSAITGSRKTDA